MKMKKTVIATALAATALTGCANMSNTEQGAIIGTAAGTVAAYNLSKGHGDAGLAILVGALIGQYVGTQVGGELDRRDRELMGQSTHTSLETLPDNVASTWNNPNTGHSGTTTPTRTYQVASGQYCREYTQTVVVAGKEQQAYGTACRQDDGTWEIR